MKIKEYLQDSQDAAAFSRIDIETLYDDITELYNPSGSLFRGERSKSLTHMERVYTTKHIQGADTMTNGLHGWNTGSAERWFELKSEKNHPSTNVTRFLQEATNAIYSNINNTDGNFDEAITTVYQYLTIYGTACLYVDLNIDQDSIQYRSIPLPTLSFVEGLDGKVDTVFRDVTYKRYQLTKLFGDAKLPDMIQDKKPFELVTVTHCVFPTKDVTNPDTELLFSSVWIVKDDKEYNILKSSGYDLNPYIVVRWETSPESEWGRSPAIKALPAARQLNKSTELLMRSNEKQVDPPIWATAESVIDSKALTSDSGSVIFGEPGSQPPITLDLTGNFSLTSEIFLGLEEDIKVLFFTDLFVVRQKIAQQTAYEVSQQVASLHRLISPFLGRLQRELYNPLLNKVLGLIMPSLEVPEELAGQTYKVDYISSSKKQQQLQQVEPIQQFMSNIMQLAPSAPQVVNKIDLNALVDKLADLYNVPVELLKDETTVQLEELAKRNQEQQLIDTQIATQQAQTIKTLEQ